MRGAHNHNHLHIRVHYVRRECFRSCAKGVIAAAVVAEAAVVGAEVEVAAAVVADRC